MVATRNYGYTFSQNAVATRKYGDTINLRFLSIDYEEIVIWKKSRGF